MEEGRDEDANVSMQPDLGVEMSERSLHQFCRILTSTRPDAPSQKAFSVDMMNIMLNQLHMSNLMHLELIGSKLPHRLTDDDVIRLVAGLNESKIFLQELHLLYHHITDVGLEEIGRLFHPSLLVAESLTPSHRKKGLMVLDLSGNDIEGKALENTALMSQYDCPLVTLNLSFNPLSERGHDAVARIVQINSTLKRLLVNNCGFDLKALNTLLSSLQMNYTLETLSLDRPILANIQEGGIVEHFTKILPKNAALAHLSLKNHHIFDNHAVLLANSLFYNSRMISLNLEANNIGVIGAEALASCILARNANSLQYLGLSYNSIRNDGAIALADCIKAGASNLKVLTLRNNRIGPVGLLAIAQALESADGLQRLEVFGNDFDNESGKHFHKLIEQRLPYFNIVVDISVYVVDGQYMIAENSG